MGSPAIICHNDTRLFQKIKGRSLVVMAAGPEELKKAADNAALSGNRLLNVVISVHSLDLVAPREDWAGIPVIIIARSFGTFRNFQDRIDMMRRLNITVHMPCDSPANITGLKVLSSLGINTTAMIFTEDPDWDSLKDLAAYALLSPAPHAPMEPFDHVARNYSRPSKYIDWEFLYFEGPERFTRMDRKGNIIPEASVSKKRPDRDHACYRCPGWTICHGKFIDRAYPGECSEFFTGLIDTIERSKRKNKLPECAIAANAPPGEAAIMQIPDDKSPAGRDRTEKDGPLWIDLKGGAPEALLLSSALKHVIDRYPSQKYAAVSRTHQDPILAGHPALLQTGSPPQGATILRIDPPASGASSDGTPYQAIARTLGLEMPAEETLYVPWKFEDDPLLLSMVPRKEKNILIVAGNGPAHGIPPDEWESLVHLLANDNVMTVQAGNSKDAYVRGAYDIRGLLQLRQLISLPRHFNAVITADILMLYAARLCSTPGIIVTGQNATLPKYPGHIHFQNPRAKAIYNAIHEIL